MSSSLNDRDSQTDYGNQSNLAEEHLGHRSSLALRRPAP
jgi:hypothetical protein